MDCSWALATAINYFFLSTSFHWNIFVLFPSFFGISSSCARSVLFFHSFFLKFHHASSWLSFHLHLSTIPHHHLGFCIHRLDSLIGLASSIIIIKPNLLTTSSTPSTYAVNNNHAPSASPYPSPHQSSASSPLHLNIHIIIINTLTLNHLLLLGSCVLPPST